MNPRIKLFIFVLLIIGVVAALSMPAKVILFTVKLYEGTASPYSTGYMGTSMFYNYLLDKNYSVYVADSWSSLLDEASKGNTTIFIIAPDKPITRQEALDLYTLIMTHNVTVVIADENVTSNTFLSLVGVAIDGRLVFQETITPEGIDYTPYPDAIFIDGGYKCIPIPGSPGCMRCLIVSPSITLNLRLNYASAVMVPPLVPGVTTVNVSCRPPFYRIIIHGAISNAFIDTNDNGIPDEPASLPTIYRGETYYFMVELVGSSGQRVIVLSDSFPFTNQALTTPRYNRTYYEFIDYLLSRVAPTNATRIIIDNSHYNYKPENIGIPFHPAFILLFLGSFLKMVDNTITGFIAGNKMLTFLTSLGVAVAVVMVLRGILGLREEKYLELAGVDEIKVLAETPLRRSFIEKEARVDPKKAIENLWEIMNLATMKFYGERLEAIASSREKTAAFARVLGVDERLLYRRLRWMLGIYLKITRKRFFPIVISWRRSLGKFIDYSEQILERMGYTLMRKAGYRGIEAILH